MLTNTARRIANNLHQLTAQSEIVVSDKIDVTITIADFYAISDGNLLEDVLSCTADIEWVALRLEKVFVNKLTEEANPELPTPTDLPKLATQAQTALRVQTKKQANDSFIYVSKTFDISLKAISGWAGGDGLYSINKSEFDKVASLLGFTDPCFSNLCHAQATAVITAIFYPARYGYTRCPNPTRNL